jgi:hypothetical protein
MQIQLAAPRQAGSEMQTQLAAPRQAGSRDAKFTEMKFS